MYLQSKRLRSKAPVFRMRANIWWWSMNIIVTSTKLLPLGSPTTLEEYVHVHHHQWLRLTSIWLSSIHCTGIWTPICRKLGPTHLPYSKLGTTTGPNLTTLPYAPSPCTKKSAAKLNRPPPLMSVRPNVPFTCSGSYATTAT